MDKQETDDMDRKYQLDAAENKEFMKKVRDALLEFGKKFAAPDGTAYYLGDDGTPWTDRSRDTYETARYAHSYVLGYLLGEKQYEQQAFDAMRGLAKGARDEKNGGWFEGIKADGTPVSGKLCYTHAFAILASSSLVLAEKAGASSLSGIACTKGAGAENLLRLALDTYTEKFWDEKSGLAYDNWNTEFTELSPYRGLNANMHSVEAFLAAYDVTEDTEYHDRAKSIIDHVIGWAKDCSWRIPEHYSKDWVPQPDFNKDHPDDQFKPFGATPGHGIEWARLITQFARSMYPDDADRELRTYYVEAAEHLYGRAVADAWDSDGAPGLVYTTDWDGKPVVHERMHWVLAEAINTSAVLYRVTEKAEYAERYAMFMAYLDRFVLDHVHGSWFHELDRENHVSGKVWPGKPDLYHAIQATLVPYCDPSLSVAVALAQGKSSLN